MSGDILLLYMPRRDNMCHVDDEYDSNAGFIECGMHTYVL